MSLEHRRQNQPELLRIEEYLDELSAWLTVMPSLEREEIRREITLHLDRLAAGQEMRGLPPHAAVAAALKQFGDPHKIGSKLILAWYKEHKPAYLMDLVKVSCAKNAGSLDREALSGFVGMLLPTFACYAVILLIRTGLWLHGMETAAVFGVAYGIFRASQPILPPYWEAYLIPPAAREEILTALRNRKRPPLPVNAGLSQRIAYRFTSWLDVYKKISLNRHFLPVPLRLLYGILPLTIIYVGFGCILPFFGLVNKEIMFAFWVLFTVTEVSEAIFLKFRRPRPANL